MTDFDTTATWADDVSEDLIRCRSDCGDGGWSLYAPNVVDEDIGDGTAALLICGGAMD